MLNVVLNDVPFIGFIVTLIIALLLVLFKSINYRKLCLIELGSFALIVILFVVLKYAFENILIRDIIVFVLSVPVRPILSAHI